MKNFILAFIALSASFFEIHGQTSDQVATSKAEVLDIFFLRNINSADRDSLFQEYRKELFPIATEYGYKPIKSFRMKSILEGSSQPDFVLFAQWDDYDRREAFINDIVKLKPFFHDLRRSIWSTFDLTYYKLKEDISFTIDQENYNVITALWTDGWCPQIGNAMQKLTDITGGETILYLTNGSSPLGYHYNPEYFLLSSWPDKDQYLKYKNMRKPLSCWENINEFEY